MRYFLILLGAVVVALAVWMAAVDLWWIAVPDAIFGIGVAWMSWGSIHGEHVSHHMPQPGEVTLAPEPTPARAPLTAAEPLPKPASVDMPAAAPLPPLPRPAATAPAALPARPHKRKRRKH